MRVYISASWKQRERVRALALAIGLRGAGHEVYDFTDPDSRSGVLGVRPAGVGLGRVSAVVGYPPAGERTPSHLWEDAILDRDADVAGWLARDAKIAQIARPGCRAHCTRNGE